MREGAALRKKAEVLSEREHELLERACARNQPAEIHYTEANELRSARGRLIAIDDETISLDKPQCIGREPNLISDTPLRVYFMFDGAYFGFKSVVACSSLDVDLSRRKRVTGMTIRIPTRVREEQRRQDFRLSLAKHEITAELHETTPDNISAAPVGAVRFSVRLTNISTGGVAALCAAAKCPKLLEWDVFYLRFDLAGVPEPLVLPAEVRHLRSLRDGEVRVIGLRFISAKEPAMRAQIQQINRFIADQQRIQLREKRIVR